MTNQADALLAEVLDIAVRDFQMTRRGREMDKEWNDKEEATALRAFFWRAERDKKALLATLEDGSNE